MPPLGRHPDNAAVADTVGSILLVAITVVAATLMGALIFSFKGPAATPYANLAVTVSPGQGGWGTGDEQIVVTDLGGAPLAAAQTTIAYSLNGGAATAVSGAALGFAGGSLHIGQAWTKTLTLASTDTVVAKVITSGSLSHLLAAATLVPGQSAAGTNCPFDVNPPTVQTWVQTPSDVASTTIGAVAVTATLVDDCYGVNNAVAPQLWYCVTSAPPCASAAMVQAAAMTGGNPWTGSIPSPPWAASNGKTLEYELRGMVDLHGNTGSSVPRQTDLVQLDCSGDATPPTIQTWVQAPTDVTVRSSGAVSVTATATDNCYGVNPAALPQLWYCVTPAPPCASGAMTQAAPLVGTNPWTGSIPEPANFWCNNAGSTLEYELRNLQDLKPVTPNTGSSTRQSDLIQTHCTHVNNAPTVGLGAFSASPNDFPKMQSSSDGGAFATITEGAATQTASAPLIGTTASGSGTPNNAKALDGAVSALTASAQSDDVSGFTMPAGSTITRVVVSMDARQSASAGTSPTARLDYLVGATAGPTGSTFTVANTPAFANYPRDITADRVWTAADINALTVRGVAVTIVNRNLEIDRLSVIVTYEASGGVQKSLNLQLDWSGVPAASTQQLEINYKTTGDTYIVQVWDPTAPNPGVAQFHTRGAALGSVGFTTFTYTLTAAEYNGGAVRIRIIDATPTGLVAGTLSIDYARVTGA